MLINGVEYVRKDSVNSEMAEELDDMPYVIVRTKSAEVFAGWLKSRIKNDVILRNATQIWYWEGSFIPSREDLRDFKTLFTSRQN